MGGDKSNLALPLVEQIDEVPFEESFWTTRVLEKQVSSTSAVAEDEKRSGNVWTSAVSIAATCVGVGLFALPFAFAVAGVAFAMGLLGFFACVSFFMSYLLLVCCNWTRTYSYEEVMVSAFGRCGALLVEVAVIWLLVGAMTSILTVAGDSFASMGELLGMNNSSSSRTLLIIADLTLVALPLSWVQNSSSLAVTNAIAVCCTVLVGVMLMVRGLANNSWGNSLMEQPRFRFEAATFKAVPVIMLSLGCQVQVPCVYGALHARELKTMTRALAGAGGWCFSLYTGVAVFGILAASAVHGDSFSIPGNILESFHHHDPLALSMRVIMACAVTLVYPMLCLPCRSTLDHLIFGGGESHRRESWKSQVRHGMETLAILGTTLFFSALEHDLATVFGFTGATAGSLICYVLPAVCFMKLRRDQPASVRAETCLTMILSMLSLTCILPLMAVLVWQEFRT